MRTLHQKVLVAATAAALAGSCLQPASAAGSYDVIHRVYPIEACQHQGHFSALSYNPFDQNAFLCYDLGLPGGFNIVGPPDFQAYCNDTHPGSRAEHHGDLSVEWGCRETVTQE